MRSDSRRSYSSSACAASGRSSSADGQTAWRHGRFRLRRYALDLAIAVGTAVAIRLIGGHAFPDYDATFALIWGRDLAHGHGPDYALPLRPAGHPLLTLLTTASTPLGRQGAADVLRWTALLGAGAFVAALYRAGQAVAGSIVGAVAAVLLGTRSALWGFSLLGFMDAWAAAFVLWALVAEVRLPRRGGLVFVLLAAAGLIRPEAWLIAAVYWAWCVWADRSRWLSLGALALLGPALWIGWDLITAGGFLSSVSPDPHTPPTSSGGYGVSHAPKSLVTYIGGFMRPPEVVAAVAGAALALWRRDWRMLLPAVLIALNVVAFVLVSLQKGPLEQRYLLLASACGLLFAAYAIAAVVPRPRDTGGHSRAIRFAAAALALACLVYARWDGQRIDHLHRQVAVANALDTQLRTLVRSTSGQCAVHGRIQLPDIRLRPFIAYWGNGKLERIGIVAAPNRVIAVDAVAQELMSRSLPNHTARTAATAWRVEGPCARQ